MVTNTFMSKNILTGAPVAGTFLRSQRMKDEDCMNAITQTLAYKERGNKQKYERNHEACNTQNKANIETHLLRGAAGSRRS